jgi:SMEK domain
MDRITEILAYLKSQVELSNPSNFTDINIYAENFYRDFLNLIFGYELLNINIFEPNSAAIDLGDEVSKFAVQVTSTSDLAKVKKTVSKYNGKNLHEKYDRLVILNISMKKNYQTKIVGDKEKYELDTSKDVWDISDLIKVIGDKDVGQISTVRLFLESQVTLENPETVATEILTFQALISLLSDENHHAAGEGFVEEPDPKGKIEERFSDHTDYLKSEFKELYTEYGDVLADVFTHQDLGQVRLRRLRLHLKTYSDQILTEYSGDAKQALGILVAKFGELLATSGIEYDSTAIRFFLIDELIKCNVFPNKEAAVV